MTPALYIGNKNYSSWSMRPWLVLRWAGIAFDEQVIPLGGPGYGKSRIPEVRAVSPSGRVPALVVDGRIIHDSLAISEWAAETAPEAGLWPGDRLTRAEARAAVAEMHSGFAALRRDLSMNLRRRVRPPAFPEDTTSDIARIEELWAHVRARYGAQGPWLFGARSIADAFYAPVATRFRTYQTALSGVAQAYCETIFADADFQDWDRAAAAEPWSISAADTLYA